MSLIVTVIVPTGIVMSGDSRTSYSGPASAEPNPTPIEGGGAETSSPSPVPPAQNAIPTGLVISDATYKVFLLYAKFGVSTCGTSLINEMPVAHHVEVFELQNPNPPTDPHSLATALLAYFRAMSPIPQVLCTSRRIL